MHTTGVLKIFVCMCKTLCLRSTMILVATCARVILERGAANSKQCMKGIMIIIQNFYGYVYINVVFVIVQNFYVYVVIQTFYARA
jgi:hypothetical protein